MQRVLQELKDRKEPLVLMEVPVLKARKDRRVQEQTKH